MVKIILSSMMMFLSFMMMNQSHAQEYETFCNGYGYCYTRPVQYTHNLVGLAFTKENKHYFYTSQYTSRSRDFNSYQAKADTLSACNKSENRSPCVYAGFVANNQCIAVVQSVDVMDWDSASRCGAAKKAAKKRCQASSRQPESCKIIDTKATYHFF